jgi:transposase-like protein
MKAAALRGEFRDWSLCVFALDRLSRNMIQSIQTVLELDAAGVEVCAAKEPWLSTQGPVRSLLLAVFSWIAEQERLRISERVRCAIDQARSEGKQIGRPRAAIDLERALRLRADGVSIRLAARKLGVGPSTLHRVLQHHDALQRSTSGAVPQPPFADPHGTPNNVVEIAQRHRVLESVSPGDVGRRAAVQEREPPGQVGEVGT